jgi:hypothetical protein
MMSCSPHDDCDPERIGEITAPLKKQLAEARERAEKAERAFALQRATCETESFREQIRSQLIRDGIEAQATIAVLREAVTEYLAACRIVVDETGYIVEAAQPRLGLRRLLLVNAALDAGKGTDISRDMAMLAAFESGYQTAQAEYEETGRVSGLKTRVVGVE